MQNNKRYLTKSRFQIAIDCPTKLFYSGKSKEYRDNIQNDGFLAMLAEGGYQVGALAKLRYPNGIEIEERNHALAHAKTMEYLAQDQVVLFEPAILVGNFFIRIDILVKNGNHLELIEVKAKSYDSLKPNIEAKRGGISTDMLPYIQDAAFQTWISKQAFPKVEIDTYLMMPDKSKKVDTDGLNQMFKMTERSKVELNIPAGVDAKLIAESILTKINVDRYVTEVLANPIKFPGGEGYIQEIAPLWAEAYQQDHRIAPAIGMQCGSCQFKTGPDDQLKSGFQECWGQTLGWSKQYFEADTVLDIWNFRKKQQLMDQGIYKINQVTRHDIGDFNDDAEIDGLTRMQRQWLQVGGIPADADSDGYYFDRVLAQVEMSHWQYPYHLIDFETSAVALPFYTGMRPYGQVAFQFSHHIIEADGSVSHAGEFLDVEPGHFPNYDFARALKAELGHDNGSVFMWSPHENTILNAIIEQLASDVEQEADATELIEFLKSLVKGGNRAMVDLCAFAEKSFFHPETKGSNSIKKVLPAILKVSKKLQSIYTQPIYGKKGGITSLNFASDTGFTWLSIDEAGKYSDPYAQLKDYAKSLLPDNITMDQSVIADGGAATTAYARMQFENLDDTTRSRIKSSMLRYCELDTLAMVMIMQGWIDECNN